MAKRRWHRRSGPLHRIVFPGTFVPMEAAAPPPTPAQPPAARSNPISVGTIISDAFATYSANLGVLVATSLAVAIAFGIVVGLLNDAGGALMQFLAWIVQLIGTAIYTGFVVRLVQDVRDGRRDLTVGDLFSAAAPAIGGLIIWGILSGIAIGIGFILLIVPGLILMTIWSVGAPAIVVEGISPLDAFGRSYELVRGQAWTVFGVLVCVFLIMLVAFLVAALIGAAIGGVAGAIIVGIIVLALFMPVSALVASTLYFELAGDRPAPASAIV
jgi:hypothetical protein